MTARTLERQAIQAHAAGLPWSAWWPTVAAQVAQAEPIDRSAYHRLVNRLLGLLVAGDLDGQQAVGDTEPWEADDTAAVPGISDTDTMARCRWVPGQEAMT